MDKFVVRAPTWKTKSYSQVTTTSRTKTDKKLLISRSQPNASKKPLQDKQQQNSASKRQGRLSICDLHRIFASSPDQPLLITNEEELVGISDNFSNGFGRLSNECGENIQPKSKSSMAPNKENNLCDLSDYVSCSKQPTVEASPAINGNCPQPNAISFSVVKEAMDLFDSSDRPNTPEQRLLPLQLPEQVTPKSNPLMARIQRDLNSPSATVRMRALKALKNPTNSAYNQFDVPHDEQSIITAEERCTPPPPPSMKDLMRNIVIYVEVRTGEDNRSAGVKKVISALGARVNDKLLRDTTHVIFKDGLLSTYKKAKLWNIPIVSILWIEACKNQCRICDPKDFPISSIDRYENPELYEKFKRHKSMQPDSECNKRVRPKLGTPKDSTPKTAAAGGLKKAINGITKTPQRQKTDISHYFKSSSSKNEPETSSSDATLVSKTSSLLLLADTPATMVTNTYKNFMPVTGVVIKRKEKNQDNDEIVDMTELLENKSLNFIAADIKDSDNETPKTKGHRRNSMYASNVTVKTQLVDMPLSQQAPTNKTLSKLIDTPGRVTRRRCSMNVVTNGTIATADGKQIITPIKQVMHSEITSIIEEETMSIDEKNSAQTYRAATNKNPRKRSTYTNKTMEISELIDTQTQTTRRRTLFSSMGDATTQTDVVQTVTNRRRTLYTPQKMECTSVAENCGAVNGESCNTPIFNYSATPIVKDKQMQTVIKSMTNNETVCMYGSKTPGHIFSSTRYNSDITAPEMSGTLLEEHATKLPFSSTRQPGRRRTLFDVSMDIISQRVENINKTARKSMAMSVHAVKSDELEREKTPLLRKCSTSPNLAANHMEQELSTDTAKKPKENEVTTPAAIPKKRKLFMPNDSPLPLGATGIAGYFTPPTNSKRRKTLMPLTQPQSPAKLTTTINTSAKKRIRPARRSSMDYGGEIEKHKDADALTAAAAAGTSKSNKKCATKKQANTINKTDGDDDAIKSATRKQLPYLVCTNMHRDQIDFIREAVDKLGGFQLAQLVGEGATHVVSFEPRRTLNLLRALARGLWILEYKWIAESLIAGKWLHEEPYEMRDFSRAVEICRAERQAFGSTYKCELFSELGLFYISTHCTPISRENLKELIILCGGKVTDRRKRAKYILSDAYKSIEDKIFATQFWILDSITHMQVQKLSRYTPISFIPEKIPKLL